MLLLHMRFPLIYHSFLYQDLGSVVAGLSCTDRSMHTEWRRPIYVWGACIFACCAASCSH